jgi:hypothetical protein
VQTIVVAGALAGKPGSGGEAWVRMSWVTGLRRLGFDVVFVEQVAEAPSAAALAHFDATVERFGLSGRAALLDRNASLRGLARDDVRERLAGAALLVNISGNLADEELRGAAPRRPTSTSTPRSRRSGGRRAPTPRGWPATTPT